MQGALLYGFVDLGNSYREQGTGCLRVSAIERAAKLLDGTAQLCPIVPINKATALTLAHTFFCGLMIRHSKSPLIPYSDAGEMLRREVRDYRERQTQCQGEVFGVR